MQKAPDYSTPNKKKRFIESECRRMTDAVEHVNGEADTYLDGAYGTRRQRAILNYLDRAEEEFKTFGLHSIVESFAHEELLPFSNYNHLDSNCDIRIGASLWILEQLRANGTMYDAYKLLPDVSGDVDAWYLPTDFYHPCYANDLIQSVIHLLTHRYDREDGGIGRTGRTDRIKNRHGIVITEENASGKKPGEAYTELLKLLPEDSVEKACEEFKNKVWDLATRRMKGQAYFDREIKRCAQQVQSGSMGGPLAGSMSAPLAGPITDPFASPQKGSRNSVIDAAEKGRELIEKEHDFSLNFETLLELDRRAIVKETGSREVADAIKGFTIKDPYELCFALFYLIDSGDDAPWLMRSGCSVILYCLRMFPWHMEQDDWDDDDWDAWYDGLPYNVNGWADREPVPDQLDLLHEKHKGRNLAQIIYELSRGVVPTDMHPFDQDRERLVTEGMDEEKARKITETADFLFLMAFQAHQRIESDVPWLDFEDEGDERDERDGGDAQNAVNAESIKNPEKNAAGGNGALDTPRQVKLGGYWGRVIGNSVDAADDSEFADIAERITTDQIDENEKLKEELVSLKKQLKSLKSTLAVTRQESNNERAKYEHELKSLRMEHRELADLRELVFNREAENPERLEKVEKQYSYPYETKKRTVVFGGHDSFLRAIKPMFTNVKFVDASNLAYSPDIIRNADVVWIQNNCISHSQYWSVVKNCKLAGVQMRYFGFASAEKCAEQLVTEDQRQQGTFPKSPQCNGSWTSGGMRHR